jgi:hypothetical protein
MICMPEVCMQERIRLKADEEQLDNEAAELEKLRRERHGAMASLPEYAQMPALLHQATGHPAAATNVPKQLNAPPAPVQEPTTGDAGAPGARPSVALPTSLPVQACVADATGSTSSAAAPTATPAQPTRPEASEAMEPVSTGAAPATSPAQASGESGAGLAANAADAAAASAPAQASSLHMLGPAASLAPTPSGPAQAIAVKDASGGGDGAKVAGPTVCSAAPSATGQLSGPGAVGSSANAGARTSLPAQSSGSDAAGTIAGDGGATPRAAVGESGVGTASSTGPPVSGAAAAQDAIGQVPQENKPG